MRKAQEAQARYYDKNRLDSAFETEDMVLVDSRGLATTQVGARLKKFAKRWQGPFAILSRVIERACIIDLPAEWMCHTTINVGYLKKFKESVNYPMTLSRRIMVSRNAGQDEDSTEVLDSRTTQRRGTARKEFLVR